MSTSSWTPCKSSSPEYVIIFLRFAALRVPTSASKRLAHLSSWKRTPNFTLNFPSASNWENTMLANAKSVYCHHVWQIHIIFHKQLEVNQHHNVTVNSQKKKKKKQSKTQCNFLPDSKRNGVNAMCSISSNLSIICTEWSKN